MEEPPLGGADGELGEVPGELGELPAMPPGADPVWPAAPVAASPDLSVFLERLVPELLSPEFLHAASPNSGRINAMASNVFNLMCSPPFVDFLAAEQLLLLFLSPWLLPSMGKYPVAG